MTDQGGAGSHALLQSFNVDPASIVTLSFDLFVNNLAGSFFTPDSLDFNTIPNQQARVDILTAGAGAFALGSSVVDNVLTPSANSPNYLHYSFDLTNALGGGGTFQIRFAEVDNQFSFNLGVDNVSIQASPSVVPEPRSWAALALILLGLGGMRRYAEDLSPNYAFFDLDPKRRERKENRRYEQPNTPDSPSAKSWNGWISDTHPSGVSFDPRFRLARCSIA